ncbi:MAG: DUF2723 domain-containing protein [Bacteroidia bacterium]
MANGSDNLLDQKLSRLNTIVGWCVFIVAIIVYYATVEPTASFWDCSENLSIYYKLEVGHPPGEPFLQLIQHLVSLLSFGNVHMAAPLMNHAASTFSALTILFLFWTTTFFARKLVLRNGELTDNKIYAILACGAIAGLSFTFADSMWFSAVEASVWSMSGCFTAFMFWCATKWDRCEVHPERWLILIFFLIGLSIGIHLLCLLFIPAAVLIYFFKTYPDGINSKFFSIILSPFTKSKKTQGIIVAGIAAVALTGFVKSIIIPWLINFATAFEKFFVNKMNMPFNSGVLIYGLLLTGLIVWGLNYTRKHNKPGWNTTILALTVLIIGYCSFLLLVVRASAPTPMNEDNPSDPVSLHDYLDRKQYGDWPVLYGPYYTAPQVDVIDAGPVYAKDEKLGKYIKTYEMRLPKYDPNFCVLFPRMWDAGESHPRGYRSWGGTDGYEKIPYTSNDGEPRKMIEKPSYLNNIGYFLNYQVRFMYWRYFLWNFCGRQNDIQGEDPQDNLHGNWITGISFLDAMRYPQEDQPDELASNKGHNAMYGLPLILGLIGFFYHYKKDRRNSLVVLTYFFFTGLAIILYLNQAPYQPRERDYSYVGSFYAFSMWIGLGVMALYDFATKRMKQGSEKPALALSFIACLLVPAVMAHAEWDDHDRSTRTTTRDLAIDYLESCPPNAILFTNGDNDTFPLWYAQEVEGIRTDVRVCNLELLGMSWYVDQMNRKAYNSERMPFSLTHDQYRDGTRDIVYFIEDKRVKGYQDLKDLIEFVKSDNPADKFDISGGAGEYVNYFPTKNFELKVNKEEVIKSGAVPASLQDSIVPVIDWTMPGNAVYRSTLMVLDAIAHNDWKRPICFAVTTGSEAYMGLEKYMQLEGLVYRLVPVAATPANSVEGWRVNTNVMYNNAVHKFRWGNMSTGEYLDENVRRMATDLRIQMGTLAEALIKDNKKDSAAKVLNMAMDSISEKSCPDEGPEVMFVYDFYQLKDFKKANPLAKRLFDSFEKELRYFHSLDAVNASYYSPEASRDSRTLEELAYFAQSAGQTDIVKDFQARLDKLEKAGMLKMQNQ